ncbi:fluoride efflux transporter FluC [Microbacterium sp. ZW T5_56]|uniref:fluoride efflux transporter FluC n=1 Tax=Microbacterium sp. ZW T5_56 TaxID=3378081 RepID=UPI0038552E05
MNPLLLLLIGLAGGVGAVLRWVIEVVTLPWSQRFPWGILLVNITGSFALGVVTGLFGTSEVGWILGTGLLGGYTTFSSVSAAAASMLGTRRWIAAAGNTIGTFALCLGAAAAGLAVAGGL